MEFQNIINHSSWWEWQPCAGLSGSAGMMLYLKTNNLIFAGYLQDYALASYMGYPTTAYFPGGACCGLSVVGAGGKGFFYPGTWVAF